MQLADIDYVLTYVSTQVMLAIAIVGTTLLLLIDDKIDQTKKYGNSDINDVFYSTGSLKSRFFVHSFEWYDDSASSSRRLNYNDAE